MNRNECHANTVYSTVSNYLIIMKSSKALSLCIEDNGRNGFMTKTKAECCTHNREYYTVFEIVILNISLKTSKIMYAALVQGRSTVPLMDLIQNSICRTFFRKIHFDVHIEHKKRSRVKSFFILNF